MKHSYLCMALLAGSVNAMYEYPIKSKHIERVKQVVTVMDDPNTGTTSITALTTSDQTIQSTYAPLGNLIDSRYIDPDEPSIQSAVHNDIDSLLDNDEVIELLPRNPQSFESIIKTITTPQGDVCILAILKHTGIKVINRYSSSGSLIQQYKVVNHPRRTPL